MLWDLVALLNAETIEFIKGKGGLQAIVISHPHFYTTHLEWAKVFACPVYMARDDEEWVNRVDTEGVRRFVSGVAEVQEVGGEVKVVQCGGHFDGSSVLYWAGEGKLFIADTFMSVPVCFFQFICCCCCCFPSLLSSCPPFVGFHPVVVVRVCRLHVLTEML